MNTRPTVLLYNPLSGHGHLDSWLALFTTILLKKQFRVQVLTPDTSALRTRLAQDGLVQHPDLEVLEWQLPEPTHPRLQAVRRVLATARQVAENYYHRRPASIPTPDMPLTRRLKKQVLQLVAPPVYGLVAPLLPAPTPEQSLPPRSDEDAACSLDPAEAALRIRTAQRTARTRPEFVLHMYMDMFSSVPERWRLYSDLAPIPWAGVQFVPATVDNPEPYYALPTQRGMCFLDERACADYGAAFPDKHFALLPDTTFAALPDTEPALVQTLRARAKGRRIVFLGGSIGGQKNLARFAGVVRKADPARWFFAMVGEVHRNTLSEDDAAALHELETSPPENYLAHAQFLDDERDFNALIAASSILFAVYRRFSISSNMPGKAASLERPILVADGFLMGDRVTRYGIGHAVPEDDENAMLAALEQLAEAPVPPERFAAYRSDFSEKRLGDSLAGLLARCLS